jgi:Uma2 family endonuclease
MTLGEFDVSVGRPGYLYELSRGVITVVDIPDRKHFAQVDGARQQFAAYRVAHPQRIHRIAGGAECKILLTAAESERHPDIAIYQTAAPDEGDLWSTWIPEIAIEVVSSGSEHRDYVEKREEYLQFGILEYWIIDFEKQQMLVLRRASGAWGEKVVQPGQMLRTRLLPGFAFDLTPIFEAAAGA